MGRYWALNMLSVALRLMGVLFFGGYVLFWLFYLINPPQNTLQVIYTPSIQSALPASPENFTDFGFILYQTVYFIAAIIFIFLVAGWPLFALTLYAAGQWISLHIDSEFNTRRVAARADDAQRRRLKLPAVSPEDEKFWQTHDPEVRSSTQYMADESQQLWNDALKAQQPKQTPQRPITARMPQTPPERGTARARITYNQDPKPREKRRLQASEEPTSGDTYTYGRPGKRDSED